VINEKIKKSRAAAWSRNPITGYMSKGNEISVSRRDLDSHFDWSNSHRSQEWEQPRCPLTDEWIPKMWYMYNIECYTAPPKNGILPFVKW
jgi:hypothetical protein